VTYTSDKYRERERTKIVSNCAPMNYHVINLRFNDSKITYMCECYECVCVCGCEVTLNEIVSDIN